MSQAIIDRFIEDIVRKAGATLLSNFGKVTTGQQKSARGDIVTKADYEAEDVLISSIRKKYPYHHILSEEAGTLQGKGLYTWIIDPLDGTTNFAKEVPLFCVILALAKGSVIERAAMYDPIHDLYFYARRGKGSTLNGKKLSVSDESNVEDATVTISNVTLRSSLEKFAHWRSLFALYTTHYKAYGSAGQAMMALARGQTDAYITGGVYPWDVAAGGLIVREAGGRITTLDGGRWNWRDNNQQVLVTNGKLHRKVLKMISS